MIQMLASLLLLHPPKRQGSMKSLSMSITIVGSTGRPEAAGQKHLNEVR
jgi:hypothetical protein